MICYGPKYTAIFNVFSHLLDQSTVKYASLAHASKTPDLTTPSGPRDENR